MFTVFLMGSARAQNMIVVILCNFALQNKRGKCLFVVCDSLLKNAINIILIKNKFHSELNIKRQCKEVISPYQLAVMKGAITIKYICVFIYFLLILKWMCCHQLQMNKTIDLYHPFFGRMQILKVPYPCDTLLSFIGEQLNRMSFKWHSQINGV